MTRPARVVINLGALRHNLARVRELSPNSRIMAIVKADAYGHGITRVATVLSSADAFGVAFLKEKRNLGAPEITHPFVLREGLYAASDLTKIVQLTGCISPFQ